MGSNWSIEIQRNTTKLTIKNGQQFRTKQTNVAVKGKKVEFLDSRIKSGKLNLSG